MVNSMIHLLFILCVMGKLNTDKSWLEDHDVTDNDTDESMPLANVVNTCDQAIALNILQLIMCRRQWQIAQLEIDFLGRNLS